MKLPFDYIAGFVDGEGCFALKFRRDFKKERINQPEYFHWGAEFAITLRADDQKLLESIKNTLGYGHIYIMKDKEARYSIQDIKILKEMIVPFFNQHRLYGKKWYDFRLWAEAIEILYRNKSERKNRINLHRGIQGFTRTQWSGGDLERLKLLYNQMRPIKSKSKTWKWLK